MARLLDLQRQTVASGRRKPSYGDLIEALVDCSGQLPFEDIAAALELRS